MHSFVAHPRDEPDVLGRAEYGSPFVAAVERGSFHGVQFHPEKSSTHGLRLLANFVALCAGSSAEPRRSTHGCPRRWALGTRTAVLGGAPPRGAPATAARAVAVRSAR